MNLQEALDRLNGVKKLSGEEYQALCPAHQDKKQSLSLTEKGGKLLLHCFAGCEFDDVLNALGSTQAQSTARKVVARYNYYDEQGVLAYYVERTNLKDFWQKKPDGSKIGDSKRFLYHLPEVIKAELVFITEGERDADTLKKLGLVATTVSGGASSNNWKPHFTNYLKGKKVILLPDNDEPGLKFMCHVADQLTTVTNKVKLIRLPGLGEKEDVSDWIANDHSRTELIELVKSTEKYSKKGLQNIQNSNNVNSVAPNYEVGNSEAREWTPPIKFNEYTLPEFPLYSFPVSLTDWVNGVAVENQVPPELPAFLGLAVIATAVQRKFVIQPKLGWHEPLSAWVVAAMESGDRKSPTFNKAIRPILAYERKQRDLLKNDVANSQAAYDALQEEYDSVRRQKKLGREEKTRQLAALKIDLAQHKPIRTPRWVTDDATPEVLAKLLKHHDESLAVISAEADTFQIIAGRYSKGLNMELYLKSYSGDPITVDRQHAPSIHLDHPALSMAMTCQPALLNAIGQIKQFRSRGLLGRFWLLVPNSMVGHRDTLSASLGQSVQDEYEDIIVSLLDIEPQRDEYGSIVPYVLRLSEEAKTLFYDYEAAIEPQLRKYGELSQIPEWAKKLVGSAARLAGLFHLVENRREAQPWAIEISGETISQALIIAEHLKQHSLAAHDLMGANPVVEDAKYLFQRIKDSGERVLSRRTIFQLAQKRFVTVPAMAEPLELLLEHDYLRKITISRRSGGGRNPSPKYEVNPTVSVQRERKL